MGSETPRAPCVSKPGPTRNRPISAGAWRPKSASSPRQALPPAPLPANNAPGQLASALRGFTPPVPHTELEDNGSLPQVVTIIDSGKAWSDGQSTCVPGSDIFFRDARSCASSNPDVSSTAGAFSP